VILTIWGYLLLSLFGLAVGLFCWLSYASLTCATRSDRASGDELRRSAADLRGVITPGAG